MTTRSRFALVLGLAGLAVAGVQLAMLSDPPTVVQLVVLSFWSVVGVAYLVSAAAQRLRGRRRPAAPVAAPAPAPLEEIVPVPVRPARPRSRPTAAGAAREGHAAQGPEASRPADRAPRTEVASAEPTRVTIRGRRRPEPAPAAPATAATAAAAPAAVSIAPPTPATVTSSPPARVPPPPEPEETTDAFTVRTGPALRSVPPAGRPDDEGPARRPPLRAVSGDGFASALSFGPSRGRTVAGTPGRSGARRPRPTPPHGQPRVAPVAGGPTSPSATAGSAETPASTPATRAPVAGPIPLPSASPLSGPVPVPGARPGAHAAPTGTVPVPRRPRHRADVEDPVAARRGAAGGGRHAGSDPPAATRGVGHEGR